MTIIRLNIGCEYIKQADSWFLIRTSKSIGAFAIAPGEGIIIAEYLYKNKKADNDDMCHPEAPETKETAVRNLSIPISEYTLLLEKLTPYKDASGHCKDYGYV